MHRKSLMNIIIKKAAFALAALALLGTNGAMAQQLVRFESSETGVCVNVPDFMEIAKHDETILHLQSDDIVFSVHPMSTENLTEEALGNMMAQIATEAGCDLSAMENEDFDHATVEGTMYGGVASEGVGHVVGTFSPKGLDSIIYLFTLTFSANFADEADAIINSIEFDPDVIE